MHKRLLNCFLAGLGVLLTIAAAPAFAQEDIDPALDRLIDAGQSAQGAIAEAARQEAENDPLGAAATLERALIDNPGADAVRIEYVILLCKLDDRGSARQEFDLLRSRTVGGQAWNRMVATCGEDFASSGRRTGEFNASIAAGLAFDSNAAEQLTSYNVFTPGTRSGLALVASAQIDARIDAGSGYLYGRALALTHSDLSGADNEYQFGEAAIGYGEEFGKTGISAGPVIRHGRLFGNSHVTAYGGQARLASHLGDASQVIVAAEVVHEDYVERTFSGTHFDFMVGFDTTTTSNQRYFVGIGAERKSTGSSFAEYKGVRLAGSLDLPLDQRGTTLNGSFTLRRIVFDQEAGFPSPKQWRLFARLGAQIPIIGKNLFIEPAATYRRRDYNAASFLPKYSSVGGELRLVWKL